MKNIIIFDLDNTFYNYEESHSAGLINVFINQSIYENENEFKEFYEQAKKRVQDRINLSPSRHSKLLYFKEMFYGEMDLKKIVELELLYWKSFIERTKINQASIEILRKIKSLDSKFFLFTNQNTNIQLKKIYSWNLDFFDQVVTSEELGAEKPSPVFFDYAKSLIDKSLNQSSNIFALGDDYFNDLDFWYKNYGAQIYLIDNNLKKLEDKNFPLGEEIPSCLKSGSFELAVQDIANHLDVL
jgi:putative hydrolase of the HAD superfamily